MARWLPAGLDLAGLSNRAQLAESLAIVTVLDRLTRIPRGEILTNEHKLIIRPLATFTLNNGLRMMRTKRHGRHPDRLINQCPYHVWAVAQMGIRPSGIPLHQHKDRRVALIRDGF